MSNINIACELAHDNAPVSLSMISGECWHCVNESGWPSGWSQRVV